MLADTAAGNRILDALPPNEAASIVPYLEGISLKTSDVLYGVGDPLRAVYFPTNSVLSAVAVMHDGRLVEIGTIGREGMAGIQAIFGVSHVPSQLLCQIPGEARFLAVDAFVDKLERLSTFRRLVLRYAQGFVNLIGQSVACNRLHDVTERCARWLLMTRDRIDSDEFPVTQEFLAMMLGVRRSGVTVAATALQQAGFIRYRRGHVTVIDRRGLESASCECYRTIADEFDRLLRG